MRIPAGHGLHSLTHIPSIYPLGKSIGFREGTLKQRRSLVLLITVTCLLTATGSAAQEVRSQAPRRDQDQSGAPVSGRSAVIPAGEHVVLRLEEWLLPDAIRRGTMVRFTTLQEIYLGNQLALPAGSVVRSSVTLPSESRTVRQARFRLPAAVLTLPDGSEVKFSAGVVRWGHTQAGRAIRFEVLKGAKSVDLEWPGGTMVEVEFDRDVALPAAANPSLALAIPVTAVLPDTPERGPQPDSAVDGSGSSRARRKRPPPAETPPPNLSIPPPPLASGSFKMRVNVNLVLIEATVLDRKGLSRNDLTAEDFRVFEDGVEQSISHLSRDALPLAIALVLDSSESIRRYREEFQRVAQQTLNQLKPADRVTLFAFADHSHRVETLTNNLERLVARIGRISFSGSTNITDALFDAARYLKAAAPSHRHVLILISDNKANILGRVTERSALRMAFEAETALYSLSVGAIRDPKAQMVDSWIGPSDDSVDRFTQALGGEIIDVERSESLAAALETVLSRLKYRYTLGYSPRHGARDGQFRRVEVRLVPRYGRPGSEYRIRAREGYFARQNE